MYSGRALEARRHLLSMFHDQQTVSRWEFAEFVKLSPEMCKNMLNEIAYLGPDKRWNLKVEPDHEFMSRWGLGLFRFFLVGFRDFDVDWFVLFRYPDLVDAQVKTVLEEAAR